MQDIVRKFGYLCLGSRLKRIGERLQSDVAAYAAELGMEVQPGQFPILAAIDLAGEASIGELVEATGVSQPGVTRAVAKLVESGLLTLKRTDGDRRLKTVALTPEGEALVERAKTELWPLIHAAAAEACAGLKGSLLEQLGGLEDGLAEEPLQTRAARLAAKKKKR